MSYLSAQGQLNGQVDAPHIYNLTFPSVTAGAGAIATIFTTPVLPAGAYLAMLSVVLLGAGVTSGGIFVLNANYPNLIQSTGGDNTYTVFTATIVSDGISAITFQFEGQGATWTTGAGTVRLVRLP